MYLVVDLKTPTNDPTSLDGYTGTTCGEPFSTNEFVVTTEFMKT